MAARDPRIAITRALANSDRFRDRVAKPALSKTGDQLIDALAWLAVEDDRCRIYVWKQIAELRTAAYETANDLKVACASHLLAGWRGHLNILANRRRQALLDGGAAEAVYYPRMRRASHASSMRDLYLDRTECEESSSWLEFGKAARDLIFVRSGMDRYRADAWSHFADFHRSRAIGIQPDAEAVADLRHCRVRIAELQIKLPTVLALAEAEAEVEGPW